MRTLVPGRALDQVPAGWGVRRAVRLAFPGPAARSADPVHTERLRVYLADLLQPHGLALDEQAFGCGGQSYGEMAEELIQRAVPPGESVDLLVLAYSVPDITPGRATATWLSHVCPGRPLALAVSDQGPAGAFTALRLVRAYAAGAGLARALLLLVEQPALPYPPAGPVALPAGAYGVALLLGPPTPGDRRRPVALGPVSVRPRSAADLLPALAGAPGPVTALLGPAVAAASHPALAEVARVRTADPGRPATGVWWELVAELGGLPDRPDAPRRLLLADRTPAPAGLSLAAFDTVTDPHSAVATAVGQQR
ncbi:hypothetical protein [Streptomyces sp. NBC_01198]|uniref:hypothetical protein n=1 Tax=Streptomyces sp. NBC_01198 TaxID=2903769 RepID=UPI002E0EC426|nr:hypothetical protein OG702_05765 [Streptomyces sp. NBC_01198]